jgi:hypothetical protein
MFYHPRAPTEFFRVEDASSRASYVRRKGIFAEDEYAGVDFDRAGAHLFDQVEQHLRWENRRPTPFISAYSDEKVARDEAKRRCRDGKQDVRIYIIDTDRRREPIEYRHIRGVARKVGLRIEEEAWNNSEYEYIFLHHIPQCMIVGTIESWEL